MNEHIGKKVLITTSSWFYGADGKQYRAIHGTLNEVCEVGKTMGFIPNRAHANWFIRVGNMVIMGCQVMYVLQSDTVDAGRVVDWSNTEGSCIEYERPSIIYVVD